MKKNLKNKNIYKNKKYFFLNLFNRMHLIHINFEFKFNLITSIKYGGYYLKY